MIFDRDAIKDAVAALALRADVMGQEDMADQLYELVARWRCIPVAEDDTAAGRAAEFVCRHFLTDYTGAR